MDYRGARFYDAEVARFLSLDPLAAEFPEWSDYNYVLGNPVMFVDPDGKAPTGDFINEKGKVLGNDGNKDNKIHIVSDKESIEKIKENTDGRKNTNLSTVKVLVTTTTIELGESLNMLKKNSKNLGLKEEGSVVTPDGGIYRSKSGEKANENDKNMHGTLPKVSGQNNTSIHLHPTAVTNGLSTDAVVPGPDDPAAFKNFALNIIVGREGTPTRTIGEPNGEKRPLVVAFFGRSITTESKPIVVIKAKHVRKALRKIKKQ